MSCDKGWGGDCCCECEHQLEIMVCGCDVCSKVTGYICLAPTIWNGIKRYECTHKINKHGACEMFTPRAPEILKEMV